MLDIRLKTIYESTILTTDQKWILTFDQWSTL